MHHYVRYNLKTGEITGQFSVSSNEFLPDPLSAEEGQIELTEEAHLKLVYPLSPDQDQIRGMVVDGVIQRLSRESIFPSRFELTADLDDRDGDGVPEAPADGRTEITIRARLVENGKRANAAQPKTVRFQTTRGTLSRRTAPVERGMAEVSLRAISETTTGEITATAEGSLPATLTIEFIPVDEYAGRDGKRRRSREAS
jgi:hypothetical protein